MSTNASMPIMLILVLVVLSCGLDTASDDSTAVAGIGDSMDGARKAKFRPRL